MSLFSFLSPRIDDSQQRLAFKNAALLANGIGMFGIDIFRDGEYHTGNWNILHAVNEAEIVRLDFAPGTSTGTLDGITLCCGDRIYNSIVGVQAVGTVILYRVGPCGCAAYS